MSSAICSNLDQYKVLSSVNGLIPVVLSCIYVFKNSLMLMLSSVFTHFNTSRKKASGKHCGKTRNCSKLAISPFTTMFSMQSVS